MPRSRRPEERKRQIADLNRRQAELQLQEFLDGRFIAHADIPGTRRKTISRSTGLWDKTAADVIWSMRVPGIGSDMKGKLMAWRRSEEQRFVFDPKRKIDPREIQKIDANLFTKSAESKMTSGDQGPVEELTRNSGRRQNWAWLRCGGFCRRCSGPGRP